MRGLFGKGSILDICAIFAAAGIGLLFSFLLV